MRVELYGIARLRAGTEAVDVDGETLGAALRALAARCPALVPEVVAGDRVARGFVCSLNGDRFVRDPATPLGEDDTLLVLGADAGG